MRRRRKREEPSFEELDLNEPILCPECHGDGFIDGEVCMECLGDGTIENATYDGDNIDSDW